MHFQHLAIAQIGRDASFPFSEKHVSFLNPGSPHFLKQLLASSFGISISALFKGNEIIFLNTGKGPMLVSCPPAGNTPMTSFGAFLTSLFAIFKITHSYLGHLWKSALKKMN